MTSKERVLQAIAHRQPDRVPIDIYARAEIWRKLEGRLDSEDLLSQLGVDFRYVHPRYIGPPKPVPDHCDYADLWGVGFRAVSMGEYTNEENVYFPFRQMKTVEEVESYPWPEPDQFDYSDIERQCEVLSQFALCTGGWDTPDINNGTSFGRGMEQVMVDIMLQDPVGTAIIDKRLECLYGRWVRTLEAARGKIDILTMGEDCGNMMGLMYPPKVYHEFFRPRTQRFIDLAHDFGCKTVMHCCGKVRDLIPAFIEMGLDAIMVQPDPDGMRPEQLKRDFGDKITFLGLLSVQRTLPFATTEQCRSEVRRLLEVMGKGGGYLFGPANLIQPDTPIENVLSVYEEAQGLQPGSLIKRRKAL